MDQDTRNRLRNVVTACRRMLEESVEQVLQGQFDIYATAKSDAVHADEKADLKSLSVEDRTYRADIIAHLRHIEALGYTGKTALKQLVREIAFTHLNRLCAYKMMAAREVWVGGQRFRDVVGKGMQSQGFDFYLAKHDADKRLSDEGHRDIAYRHYLNWVGGLLSEEIGVLFSPNDPANRLYPPQRVLDNVLAELNGDDLKGVWEQDETIGWVYQYFTPKELRDEVRKESQAPRNSYELAFRNQFFTPRYVVEFLTDNTLGRIWYEMRQSRTRLAERCCYLVRRPDEVFLSQMTVPEDDSPHAGCVEAARLLRKGDEKAFPAFDGSEDSVQRIINLAHTVSAYDRHPDEPFPLWSSDEGAQYAERPGELSTQFILDGLFMTCRADRHGGNGEVYTQDWFIKLANEVRRRALAARNPELKAEELLKLPVFVPFRRMKDPRELRVLDPACGSGHFLLYCFDLLLTIYEEAYETDAKLKEEYATIDDLRRDVPRLILAHNLHGIDIDPRAAQIAALALWLRCQRRYREMGLKEDRPKISRSNIVCAEPMPGERQMLKEFVNQELGSNAEGKLLGQLVEVVFDKMKLAGEAGSLLKIEEEIRKEVAEAKRQFQSGGLSEQPSLPGMENEEKRPVAKRYAVRKLDGDEFFEEAEGKVVESLRAYAEKAHNGDRMQRRLFTDDAVRGFAFVEMCHQRFDVVLMNPPFGAATEKAKEYVESIFPLTKNDLYATFVERAVSLTRLGGIVGVISSRTGFFLSSFREWRESIVLSQARLRTVVDLGFGVLDTAKVEAAAYCLQIASDTQDAAFFRLLWEENKSEALLDSIHAHREGTASGNSYLINPSSFEQITGSPFVYWVSERVRKLFASLPRLEGVGREARQGLVTADDFRFVRAWWEVPSDALLVSLTRATPATYRNLTLEGKRWVPVAKGGELAPFAVNLDLVVNWADDGKEIRNLVNPRTKRPASRAQNTDYYFRAGLTWPARPWLRGAFAVVPEGAIFTHTGMMLFVKQDDLWATAALLNSDAFVGLLHLLMARGSGIETDQTLKYEIGYVGNVPIPLLSSEAHKQLTRLGREAYTAFLTNSFHDETSRKFFCPARLDFASASLTIADEQLSVSRLKNRSERQVLLDEINAIAFQQYGVEEPDVSKLRDGVGKGLADSPPTAMEEDFVNSEDRPAPDVETGGVRSLTKSLISYCMGVVFGRWDVTKLSNFSLPEVDPLAPLPICPPGSLQNMDGRPADESPSGYPVQICQNGVLVDDSEQGDDVVRRVRGIIDMIWKDHAALVEKEACSLLDVDELHDYFRKPGKGGFWDDHVSRYSKSRRKAPIYWLLQSSKKNYGLWVYYHRLDKDTLFKAVQPGGPVQTKINLEQTKLGTLRTQKADLGAAKGVKKLDKDIEKQELFVAELQDFEEKLRRAANLDFGKDLDSSVVYEPDLNDGVVLNIAPLWELVPWKEAKNYWDALLAGEYEWSSMSKLLRKKGLVK